MQITKLIFEQSKKFYTTITINLDEASFYKLNETVQTKSINEFTKVAIEQLNY